MTFHTHTFTSSNLPSLAFMKSYNDIKALGGLSSYNLIFDLAETIYVIIYKDDLDIPKGMIIGAVYKHGTVSRNDQWNFGENTERELWIDYIWSGIKGIGKQLMHQMETLLCQHIDNVHRKNIYVLSANGTGWFYNINGYSCIDTPPRDGDVECTEDFMYGVAIGFWYAKNMSVIGSSPEHEYIREPSISSIIENKRRGLYGLRFVNVIEQDDLVNLFENRQWGTLKPTDLAINKEYINDTDHILGLLEEDSDRFTELNDMYRDKN
uniref:Uncharacterized protein n=1 Tax=viral metagenome TaxID=1070528 RepID=A0A6C0J536_9ZZZZ